MYRWEIWDGWDIVLVQNISLKIKDCKVHQAVKAAPGRSVKIDCQEYATPGQQALSNISWAKLKGSNRISVDSERIQMNGTYLAIQSAKASDSGWYRCTYTLGETQRCSDINLRIQDPLDSFEATTATVPPVTTAEEVLTVRVTVQISGPGERNETLIPAVVSVAGVILLLAALAGFFIHRRRKTQSPTRQIQMRAAVSTDAYENLTLPYSPHAGDRVNSLYQFPEESVLTFKY
ncbi:unnamed protein product [Menidia menidia]|uniref:(Atlantic silverside) hypothetical protein n=1 Tax=Menidia menidia TaxID=238744 RepID=A0A8S4BYD1_9TELE|nr:unnamed protein product [Menidia menidia]